MNRAADATIKGFHYQFLQTINACINLLDASDDKKIICEGAEDLDIIEQDKKILIQVKTASGKLSINSESVKKTILNFYLQYQEDKEIEFILFTNNKPGSSIINGVQKEVISSWIKCQDHNWDDINLANELLQDIKCVIEDYSSQKKKENFDYAEFDLNFLKIITLSLGNPDVVPYEDLIIERLHKRFPSVSDNFLKLVYLNLLHFVILKSINKNIFERTIFKKNILEIISQTESDLRSSYKDIILTDENNTFKYELSIILDRLGPIEDAVTTTVNDLQNNGMIEQVNVPETKIKSYESFDFVRKMLEAKLPIKQIFDAKNCFYQAEHALEVEEVIGNNKKESHVKRVKSTIKSIYEDSFDLASEKNESNIGFYIGLKKEIRNESKSILNTPLKFDWFHNVGLLHHIADEDSEIIWNIQK